MKTTGLSTSLGVARSCLTLMKQEWALFAIFMVASVLAALTEGLGVSLLVPILQGQGLASAFDQVPVLSKIAKLFAGMSGGERMKTAAVALGLVIIARGILLFAVDAIGMVIPIRLTNAMALQSFHGILNVEVAFLNRRSIGELDQGISGFPGRVSQVLTNFAAIIWNGLILAVYFGLMLMLSWKLTLLAFGFMAAVSIGLRRYSGGPLGRAGIRLSEIGVQVSTLIQETLGGMKLIRLLTAERKIASALEDNLAAAAAARRRMALLQALMAPLMATSAGLFLCVLLFGNAVLHDADDTSWVGSLILFLFVMMRMLTPVTAINNSRGRIRGDLHALEMLNAFLAETDARRQPSGHHVFKGLEREIRLEGVRFAYSEEDAPALAGTSLVIPRGETVAVVGPSGAGKTTLVSLLARFYDPQQGRVLIDGTDLRELDVSSWRRRIALVSQDIFIFDASVRDNICFGHDDVPLEKVREAARLASADGFIENLPQGYDTLLGNRGLRLSGGQQQRIAIARAILANPELLVLDEATSHLDSVTEAAVQRAIEMLRHDRTVLIIAHRLSTVRSASKIVVMVDGRVAEEGGHEELVRRRGVYWDLLSHQKLDLMEDV